MTYTKTKQQPNIKLDKTKTKKTTTRVSIPNNTIQWYQPKDSSYFHGQHIKQTKLKPVFLNFSEHQFLRSQNHEWRKQKRILPRFRETETINELNPPFACLKLSNPSWFPPHFSTSSWFHLKLFVYGLCYWTEFPKQNKAKQINLGVYLRRELRQLRVVYQINVYLCYGNWFHQ